MSPEGKLGEDTPWQDVGDAVVPEAEVTLLHFKKVSNSRNLGVESEIREKGVEKAVIEVDK